MAVVAPKQRKQQEQQEQLEHMRERPAFHISSAHWLNGPLYANGRYHLFFQSVTTSAWTWGLGWGHASSKDLITWTLLPDALNPSPGGFDADGCFSGCAVVDEQGVPTLMYTGVVKRPDRAWAEGQSLTCSKLAVERQLLAQAADKDDPNLISWTKKQQPWLDRPPDGLPVNCFRDPFMLERPWAGNGGYWRIMIGSAVESSKGQCESCEGAALVYRSKQLQQGWEYEGMLCKAPPGCGQVWECPVLGCLPPLPHLVPGHAAQLARSMSMPRRERWRDKARGQEAVLKPARTAPVLSSFTYEAAAVQEGQQPGQSSEGIIGGRSGTHATLHAAGTEDSVPGGQRVQQGHNFMFSASTGTCPSLFWLGDYRDGRFDIDAADGPYPLDLGDIAYAPNLLKDAYGRIIMWLWLREHPSSSSGPHDYVGAISVPRVLHLHGDHMHQQPLPELEQLHTGVAWRQQRLGLDAGATPMRVPISSTHMDFSACFHPIPSNSSMTQQGHNSNGNHSHDHSSTLSSRAAAATGGGTGPCEGSTDGSAAANGSSAGPLVAVVVLEALEAGGQRARIAYDFDSCELSVTVAGGSGHKAADRRLGGRLACLKPGDPLELRLLLDGSVLECFFGNGQALATQVYRNAPRPAVVSSSTFTDNDAGAGIGDGGSGVAGTTGLGTAADATAGALDAFAEALGAVSLAAEGCGSITCFVEAHEMGSIWADGPDL